MNTGSTFLSDAPSIASDWPASRVRDDGQTTEWPVPWMAVEGKRGGVLAWIEYLAVCGVARGFSFLPNVALNPIIGGLARIGRRFDSRHTKSAGEFLRQAFSSEMSDAEVAARVLQCYRHLIGVTIRSEGWKKHVLADDWYKRVEVELSPEFEALRGRGSIMICPHVGDWEAAGAFLVRLGFGPIYAIAKPAKNKPLSRHIQRTREGRGVRMLPRHGGIKHAAQVIEGGGILCLLIDQRARQRGVLAPFFGRQALCDRSAGVLLKKLKAPITMGAVYLDPQKPYHVRVDAQAVLMPEDFAKHSIEQIMTRINVELEKLIMKHPEQYFWLHDRYRGAPQ